MRILRAADRVATPWKNGGGLTSEVAVFPTGSSFETFDWRVSIAEIRQRGPFSRFEGVERRLAVISGQLALAVGSRWARYVSSATSPITLAGEDAAYGSPIAGFVTDLNLMVRRARFRATMERRELNGAKTLEAVATTSLIVALDPLTLTFGNEAVVLGKLDAATLEEPRAVFTVAPQSAAAELFWIELNQEAGRGTRS